MTNYYELRRFIASHTCVVRKDNIPVEANAVLSRSFRWRRCRRNAVEAESRQQFNLWIARQLKELGFRANYDSSQLGRRDDDGLFHFWIRGSQSTAMPFPAPQTKNFKPLAGNGFGARGRTTGAALPSNRKAAKWMDCPLPNRFAKGYVPPVVLRWAAIRFGILCCQRALFAATRKRWTGCTANINWYSRAKPTDKHPEPGRNRSGKICSPSLLEQTNRGNGQASCLRFTGTAH